MLHSSRSFRVLLLLLLLGVGISLLSPAMPTVLARGEPGHFKLLGSHKLGPRRSHTLNQDGGACDPKDCGTPPLLLKGGTVIHDPQMYLIFWGSWWLSSAEVSSGIVPGMQNLFASLAGGQYNNILSQYTDSAGAPNNFIHNDVRWVTSAYDTATPPTSLTIAEIGQEVLNVMAANQWANTANTMVMVFPQPGTTYDSSFNTPGDPTCGEHDYGTVYGGTPAFVVFGMVRYPPDTGTCKQGSNLPVESMQYTASHEYAEMATNPATGTDPAWVTSDGSEIGDLCNWGGQSYQPINSSTSLFVTPLWSNAAKNSNYPQGQCMGPCNSFSVPCTSASGQEFVSPDTSSPFNGKHTVQGPLLQKYLQLGDIKSSLGEPTSEQTPVTGGQVSYFKGNGNLVCQYHGPSGSSGGIYWSSATGAIEAYEVHSCLFDTYRALHETASYLGFPVSDIQPVPGGYANYFQGNGNLACQSPVISGAIYWSSATGAYEVHSCLFDKYRVLGETDSYLGFPVTNIMSVPGVPGGYVNYFKGNGNLVCEDFGPNDNNGGPTSSGAIYWSAATGAYEVHSCLLKEYLAVNGPGGNLGFPVTDIQSIAGGNVNYFRGNGNLVCQYHGPNDGQGGLHSSGAIYWSAATGAHEVHSCLFDEYRAVNGPNGSLGFPVTDIIPIAGGDVNYFRGNGNLVCQYYGTNDGQGGPASSGAIYWSSATGAHEVHSCIDQKYESLGGPNGTLGFPISDQFTNSAGYLESDFMGGSITWVNGTAVVTYNCPPTRCN